MPAVRVLYGRDISSFTMYGNRFAGGVLCAIWLDALATTQTLDLAEVAVVDGALVAGDPMTEVTSDEDGLIQFFGPANYDGPLWVTSANATKPLLIRPIYATPSPTPESILGSALADDAVDARILAPDAVDTSAIVDLNVTTGKIAAGAVTTAKIADDAVTTGKIAAGAVGTTDLADGAVTDAKVSDVALAKVTGAGTAAGLNVPASGDATSGQVVKGSDSRLTDTRTPKAHKASHATGQADALAPSDIGAVPVTRTLNPGTGLTGGGDLSADRTLGVAAGGIGTTQLADGAVTADKIAANAVGSSELADNAVDTAAIADGTVTLRKTLGAYLAPSTNVTLTAEDGVVAVDTTAGARTLTLPAASAMTGRALRIIKTGGANVLTVQRAGSDTILPSSGTRTSVAFPSDCAMGELLIVSSGTGWHVVSGQASDETAGSRLYKWSQALAGGSTGAEVGFRLVSYDSGLRDVSADLVNSWRTNTADGAFDVRRRNGVLTLRAHIGAGTVGAGIWAATAGFRPAKSTYFTVSNGLTGATIGGGQWAETSGTLMRYTSNADAWTSITAPSESVLPTSLPGSAKAEA